MQNPTKLVVYSVHTTATVGPSKWTPVGAPLCVQNMNAYIIQVWYTFSGYLQSKEAFVVHWQYIS